VNLVDVNLLLYAYFPQYPLHGAARDWLESQLNTSAVALPWASVLGFARIASNPRIFDPAPPAHDVWQVVGAWLALDSVSVPTPTSRHHLLVSQMLVHAGRSRDLTDAHLAALAVEHGMVLCTADMGFARFPMLRWENPLA